MVSNTTRRSAESRRPSSRCLWQVWAESCIVADGLHMAGTLSELRTTAELGVEQLVLRSVQSTYAAYRLAKATLLGSI